MLTHCSPVLCVVLTDSYNAGLVASVMTSWSIYTAAPCCAAYSGLASWRRRR